MNEQTNGTQPKVVQLHPEQETNRVTDMVGMVIFLGSWAVMFAALFFSYGLIRSRADAWPPPGMEELPLLLPGINTALIVMSSFVLHRGIRAFSMQNIASFRRHLIATMGLGTLFMVLQTIVWMDLWNSGLQLSSGNYAAFFYVLTSFHALHVVVGLGLMTWLIPQVLQQAGAPQRAGRIKLTAVFWHFVDVVWVLMFVSVYVL